MVNHTIFGLGSSIFTKDIKKAARISEDLDVGMVFINEMVRSDAHLPFGGVKSSGFGRELGLYGANEFVNIKTVATRFC
jgi:succinate-semialdehyde dehydrogenase/glutarate-semialdehyde dehydrogenase